MPKACRRAQVAACAGICASMNRGDSHHEHRGELGRCPSRHGRTHSARRNAGRARGRRALAHPLQRRHPRPALTAVDSDPSCCDSKAPVMWRARARSSARGAGGAERLTGRKRVSVDRCPLHRVVFVICTAETTSSSGTATESLVLCSTSSHSGRQGAPPNRAPRRRWRHLLDVPCSSRSAASS